MLRKSPVTSTVAIGASPNIYIIIEASSNTVFITYYQIFYKYQIKLHIKSLEVVRWRYISENKLSI